MKELVYEHERVDDLQINNLKIIQNPGGFCFGIDAVLLANSVKLKKNAKIVDLGTGTAIIPILLAGKSKTSHITALEIQKEVADMAERSVKLNKLEDRIKILNIDLKDADRFLEVNEYDIVISNPPYMHPEGFINPNDKKAISRHEVKCTLKDVVRAASKLLKHNGRFFMVHRPIRLVDVMFYCRQYKLEPKYLQFVHSTYNKKPNLLLLECIKSAKPELKVLDPLYVYDKEGKYTDEIFHTYGKTHIEEEDEFHE